MRRPIVFLGWKKQGVRNEVNFQNVIAYFRFQRFFDKFTAEMIQAYSISKDDCRPSKDKQTSTLLTVFSH